ncbi:SLAIN motif-containing protein 2-like [Dendronephthya gigantea]|uniref:SLAIN motif-containing protein 2-like n=2 Tax=Dendronephthya gigantea TaxID=151771 RepID=UPI001069F8E2|nr:SLAIN motif-containing protein 2-like [Dendronephthya gigantea]
MEEAFDVPPMDLKASAEQEVRKLQDMVKRLEKQNELLRNSSSQNGTAIITLPKRDSVELEEVALINLNDSSDDLEDSWLYESPVRPATPAQKSIPSLKWTKTSSVSGLDDVRGNLIDKLDDIETQQEISKVRVTQSQHDRVMSTNAPKNSLFFQPTAKTPKKITADDYMHDNSQLDSSAYGSMDEMDDIPTGPILRRSALGNKDNSSTNPQDNTSMSLSEDLDDEPQGPILRRSGLGSAAKPTPNLSQSENIDDEPKGPILRRSALSKNSPPKSEPSNISQSDDMNDETQGEW